MIQPLRLFDCLDYQLEKFPKHDMLVAKENGQWRPYSTAEVKQTSLQLAAGLLTLGVSGNDMTTENRDKIAIISNNRPEWLITDMAVQQTGAILVPIYPTTNPLEIEFIFNDAAVKYVFVSSEELLQKLQDIRSKIPTVKDIFTFNPVNGARHWSEVLDKCTDAGLAEIETVKTKIKKDDLATIIYTSGTTGTPKGVMLSHDNIVQNVFLSKECFPFDDQPQYKALSFLPLNHIFEKMVSYIYLFSGIGIYYAESLETIGANLQEVKPDVFTTVPRLLEKVYERIMGKGAELKGIKRQLFFWAVDVGKKYDNLIDGGFLYNLKLSVANKLIFSKWREALGGNIKYIITGGAACQERLIRIFNAAQIPLYEGYGPTENSPVISVNRREPGGMKFGTVGPPVKGMEVKLMDDGEICVKGPSVMVGYYKRPDLTAEAIIEGWLHTGDIGVFEDNKFLRITDRKKELFKTSGGKYVAPSAIENKLKESRFIEQVIVVGAGQKFVGALIVPSFVNLKDWCEKNGVSFQSNESIIKDPAVIAHYKEIVEQLNQNFNHVEQVKRFELLPREWSVESGEVTPKLSLKRKVIMEKYKDAIERIYGNGGVI
ncbi:long-chain fatty acid--CoA ligase [Agriterribacter sp.]|uniref:AMP-dependent synthetase/ligase n=1 Tax=Agriterribacter sp. TaxID=2821509 RepID=UPI002CF30029|nr:long-chain fatty acid--CoA ligase [Agriterribacter sp.]HRO45359.1 long-chain fatty acid--CoA ligase [Agriterribacter sp.]HRQ16949.1 long-chain fatty acid--CoA ligase [Agriterribacter sp.]